MGYRSKEITHNIYQDRDSGKEIHYVLFPADTVYPEEVEIHCVFNECGEQQAWTNEQENKWIDVILLEVNA